MQEWPGYEDDIHATAFDTIACMSVDGKLLTRNVHAPRQVVWEGQGMVQVRWLLDGHLVALLCTCLHTCLHTQEWSPTVQVVSPTLILTSRLGGRVALWDVRAGNRPVLGAQMPHRVFGARAVYEGTRANTVGNDASRIVVGCCRNEEQSGQLRVFDTRAIGSPAAALHSVAQHTLPDGYQAMDTSGNMVAVSSREFQGHTLHLEWWDMQQQGGTGSCVGRDVKLDFDHEVQSLHLSDDGRMVLANAGVGLVYGWCLDVHCAEQPLVVGGSYVKWCNSLDIADTVVAYGSSGYGVCVCQYGKG